MSFFEAAEPEFSTFVLGNAPLKKLAGGFDWVEGPVWFGDGRFLLLSDIPNDRILRWDECSGQLSVFRRPSNHANGHARDAQGLFETDFTGADKQSEKWLLTQGAMAEMYGRMSGVKLDQTK